jgi:hypothetical protein
MQPVPSTQPFEHRPQSANTIGFVRPMRNFQRHDEPAFHLSGYVVDSTWSVTWLIHLVGRNVARTWSVGLFRPTTLATWGTWSVTWSVAIDHVSFRCLE